MDDGFCIGGSAGERGSLGDFQQQIDSFDSQAEETHNAGHHIFRDSSGCHGRGGILSFA